jgi:excisionase family DNA binding protein
MPPKRKTETSAGVRTHVLGEEVFTTDEVAHDLHISVRTVLRAIHAGKLTARRAGKQYLLTRAAVREWWEGMPLVEGSNAVKKDK